MPASHLSQLGLRHGVKISKSLDPLAYTITCPCCHGWLVPFTREGVLFDWCGWCRRESPVPIRYADPVKAREREDARAAFIDEFTLRAKELNASPSFILFPERELQRRSA